MYLTVQQGSTLLYSTTLNSSGTYSFNFTPTQSTVQLSMAYAYFNTNANSLCFTLDSVNYTQQNGSTSSTQLVQISSKQSDKYRYGMNGMEKDDEIVGSGNSYDFGMRIYNPRLGRWLSIDPRTNEYPWQTPYSYHRNNPVNLTDYMGGGDPPDKNEVDLKKEGVKAYKFKGSIMTPFVSGDKTLSEAGKAQDQPKTTDYTINGQFWDWWNGNEGKSYANGQDLGGESQPGWYYISSDGKGGYSFGAGDPATNSQNAIGGGRPLIINGLQYGSTNNYSNGKASDTGPVDPANKQFLTQKSAAYFAAQNSVTKGKTIVAYNPTSKEIMIIVQQNGVNGYSMDAYRNYLAKNGFTNALSFDGSDSALLIRDKSVIIKNGEAKDEHCDSGVTFRVPVGTGK